MRTYHVVVLRRHKTARLLEFRYSSILESKAPVLYEWECINMGLQRYYQMCRKFWECPTTIELQYDNLDNPAGIKTKGTVQLDDMSSIKWHTCFDALQEVLQDT